MHGLYRVLSQHETEKHPLLVLHANNANPRSEPTLDRLQLDLFLVTDYLNSAAKVHLASSARSTEVRVYMMKARISGGGCRGSGFWTNTRVSVYHYMALLPL